MKPQIAAALSLMLAGCASAPEWYRVPAQHSLAGVDLNAGSFPEYFNSDDMGADAYLVKGVQGAEGDMRWTHEEPEFRFYIKSSENRRFRMEFNIHDVTFKDTGPVTLVFEVNGHEFARPTYDSPGRRIFEQPVPAGWLKTGEENRVLVRVLNPWKTQKPDEKLGFILYGAGFVT